jgi:hypothetical protein
VPYRPRRVRAASTWADFLRFRADALLACDFLGTVTLSGARMYVLAVIEHASRRIRILGATAHSTARWGAQATRNLVMDLEDAGCWARFLIRDRDGKFPELVDAILADAAIAVVLSGVRMPRMNSIMEQWVQTCCRDSAPCASRVLGKGKVRIQPVRPAHYPSARLWSAAAGPSRANGISATTTSSGIQPPPRLAGRRVHVRRKGLR